jgi:hypothetical protein
MAHPGFSRVSAFQAEARRRNCTQGVALGSDQSFGLKKERSVRLLTRASLFLVLGDANEPLTQKKIRQAGPPILPGRPDPESQKRLGDLLRGSG